MSKLFYTGEIIDSFDGIPCAVLDISKVDFSNAPLGRKIVETLVRCAEGGEDIITRNDKGIIESQYVAEKGDAIFINLHNPDNIYVPRSNGVAWKFSELTERGYRITGDDLKGGGVRVVNDESFPILHEIIDQPTCIKNAWGDGNHGFFFKGASLKLNKNGVVSAIDKNAFDGTWGLVDVAAPSLPPTKGPKPTS